ncbi:hypothetical protein L323_20005 [Ruminiclostridium papyrosolvens C7]|uniref:Uncharacterized protein n=1 Tax=Ruminiclostridium papyrosolvens C7 TaxID=1330534 RepID=U4QXQ8_9FIRM|nr:hypothetical protein L323_20005 [Ruminiclostridium papyrosolvens C7]
MHRGKRKERPLEKETLLSGTDENIHPLYSTKSTKESKVQRRDRDWKKHLFH